MQCGNPLSQDNATNVKKVQLNLIENNKTIKEFSISDKSKIGKGNDIDLKGADFSENICEFKFEGDKIFLHVLADGVFVKANVNKALEVSSGSELKIGDKTFKIEIQ